MGTTIGYTEPVTGKQIEIDVSGSKIRAPKNEFERRVMESFAETDVMRGVAIPKQNAKAPAAARKQPAAITKAPAKKSGTTKKRRSAVRRRSGTVTSRAYAAPATPVRAPEPPLPETKSEE